MTSPPPTSPSLSSPPAPGSRVAGRRRAWLAAAVVALLVLIYLTVWSSYAALHTGQRYRQLPPGASANRGGAQFRVLSMVAADRLVARGGGEPQTPDPGAVFVVAELEMVQQRPDPFVSCSELDLLGAGGRRWEPITTDVQRQVPYCSSDDVVVGHPYRYEAVYTVPQRYAGDLVGIALVDAATADRTAVLRPPA